MISLAQVKPGRTIKLDNVPYLVLSAIFSKTAQGNGTSNTKLKNLLTGSTIQKTFQGNKEVEEAEITYSKAQYLYGTGEEFFFMDNSTFEQFSLSSDDLGQDAQFLLAGSEVDIQNYEGRPIALNLPPKIVLKVKETEPGVKGNTATGGRKPATMETGVVVQVPLFINAGDFVRVNTETREYVERVDK
ncbi:elongation factor P [Candidatus Peregrinibacteria bacterium RIFOXYB12_FULL_41_12]|nr:MAG: elongation factor P [Candidatus Peregrinibacteria bacterium RIFOXYA2_FULL_41_18]OGJ49779.1 MAG: elongation factor P [Candidatus Peregrinibacteria bacterium RIFOXYB12_FULL_41_12]OGJ52223.1 MAG: elongation factor P [Candidatus Peregrinibacteria bacterium RIFOXYB2_FULL_41_88]